MSFHWKSHHLSHRRSDSTVYEYLPASFLLFPKGKASSLPRIIYSLGYATHVLECAQANCECPSGLTTMSSPFKALLLASREGRCTAPLRLLQLLVSVSRSVKNRKSTKAKRLYRRKTADWALDKQALMIHFAFLFKLTRVVSLPLPTMEKHSTY